MNNDRAQAALLALCKSQRLREAEITRHLSTRDADSDEQADAESPIFKYFYNLNEIDR